MTPNFFMMTLATGAMMLAATNVRAQNPNCGDHAAVVEHLAKNYGESRQSMGLGNNNAVIEVFASAETGSWTITATTAGGPTCMIAAGQAFQQMADALPNTDSGA